MTRWKDDTKRLLVLGNTECLWNLDTGYHAQQKGSMGHMGPKIPTVNKRNQDAGTVSVPADTSVTCPKPRDVFRFRISSLGKAWLLQCKLAGVKQWLFMCSRPRRLDDSLQARLPESNRMQLHWGSGLELIHQRLAFVEAANREVLGRGDAVGRSLKIVGDEHVLLLILLRNDSVSAQALDQKAANLFFFSRKPCSLFNLPLSSSRMPALRRYSSFSVNWKCGYLGDPWKSCSSTRPSAPIFVRVDFMSWHSAFCHLRGCRVFLIASALIAKGAWACPLCSMNLGLLQMLVADMRQSRMS